MPSYPPREILVSCAKMMKKYNFVIVLALSVGMLLVGCSSTPTKEQIAKDEVKASVVHATAAVERRVQEQQRMEVTLSKVPDWALAQPHPDDTGVYAVGISESDTMRVAMRKAMLDAEFGLAKMYNQELSGSERLYSRDDNSSVSKEQYIALIDKLVSQVPVIGFEVVRQEVKVMDGKYNAFILLKLPYAQFNRILQEQRAKAHDNTAAKAFDDLTRRLNERRKQHQDEAQQQKADEQREKSLEQGIAKQPEGAKDTKAAVPESGAGQTDATSAVTSGVVIKPNVTATPLSNKAGIVYTGEVGV